MRVEGVDEGRVAGARRDGDAESVGSGAHDDATCTGIDTDAERAELGVLKKILHIEVKSENSKT